MATTPLAGVRILDFTWAQQGPVSTVMLADMGAEVIKIEKRGGELGRNAAGGADLPQPAPYFVAHNRGKRSVTLDVTKAEGREVVMRFVERVDVVVSNMRLGVMDKLGLGYDDLRAVNPKIVYAAASTYGPLGPKANRPGFDIIAQALGGLMSQTGPNGAPPMPAGACIADTVGALHLCAGVLAGLLQAQRTGDGCQVDVSLYGTQLALQAWEIDQTSMLGKPLPRAGMGHPIVGGTWGGYETADGHIVLGGISSKHFRALCEAIGRPELFAASPDDERRDANSAAIVETLRTLFREQPNDYWLERLEQVGIPTAPIQTYQEVLADPEARANGYVTQLPHPYYGEIAVVGSAIQFDREPTPLPGPPPELGDHTEVYLEELGYDWDAITRLRDSEVI